MRAEAQHYTYPNKSYIAEQQDAYRRPSFGCFKLRAGVNALSKIYNDCKEAYPLDVLHAHRKRSDQGAPDREICEVYNEGLWLPEVGIDLAGSLPKATPCWKTDRKADWSRLACETVRTIKHCFCWCQDDDSRTQAGL